MSSVLAFCICMIALSFDTFVGGEWMIFNFSIVQVHFFGLLNLIVFSMSYKILPYYVYCHCILIRM